jgi:hypothetical protein
VVGSAAQTAKGTDLMDLQARMQIIQLEKRVSELEKDLEAMTSLLNLNNQTLKSLLDAIQTEKAA